MATTQIQTLAQRQAVIRRRLLQSNPTDFSTSPGSVIGNLFISPLAVSDVQQQARTYMVAVGEAVLDILALEKDESTLQLLAQALNTTTSDILAQLSTLLDHWASNFLESRLPPVKAVGSVVYGRIDPPTADITIGIGKTVESSGGIRYVTTASVTMFVASAGTYWDPNLLQFVIQVPVEADETGADGNIPADSITKIISPVNGLPFITNLEPMSGGRDLESDALLGARILEKWRAYGRLTPSGVDFYARTNVPGIEDVYVALTGDPLSLRGEGRTDVWFKGSAPTGFTEIFAAYNNPDVPNSIIPTKKPVLSLTSVDSGTAVLRVDNDSALAGSMQAPDYIQFITAPSFPVQISYMYDARVAQLQALYNSPQYAPLSQRLADTPANAVRTPLLAKKAFQIDIDYTVAIMILPGFNPAVVRSDVGAALGAFSAAWLLGETAYVTDLNQVVEAVSGVLRISGAPIKFAPVGQAGVYPSIPSAKNQYPRLLNVNIF